VQCEVNNTRKETSNQGTSQRHSFSATDMPIRP